MYKLDDILKDLKIDSLDDFKGNPRYAKKYFIQAVDLINKDQELKPILAINYKSEKERLKRDNHLKMVICHNLNGVILYKTFSQDSLVKKKRNDMVEEILELTDNLGCSYNRQEVRNFLREFNEEYLYNSILDIRVDKYKLAEIMAKKYKEE